MSQPVWSITNLVRYIKSALDHDMNLQSILIKGEISNFTHHCSGHYYFTLKDSNARISCVMFASNARRCPLQIKDGMKVLVSANVSMYEPQGTCQLYVLQIQLDGIGDLFMQLEEIKRRMNAQGYFDPAHKKPLPLYPMNIGVISARSGAATQDVFTTLKRRWPLASVFFYPCLVQGREAEQELIKTVQKADQQGHDVLLIVRGGGSIEDLWCFNSEALAKCVYACNTVIVSGVGHVTDTTLIDYVADRRAPTPTAAAELITPNRQEVLLNVNKDYQRMINAMQNTLANYHHQLSRIENHRLLKDPLTYIQHDALRLAMDVQRLSNVQTMKEKLRARLNQIFDAMSSHGTQLSLKKTHDLTLMNEQLIHALSMKQEAALRALRQNAALLDAYSPLKSVARGYSLTYDENHRLITSIDTINVGDVMSVRIKDGTIYGTITGKEPLDEQ